MAASTHAQRRGPTPAPRHAGAATDTAATRPVVDFHFLCYGRALRAPESFVAFMDRELAKAYGSFAKFLEQYGSAESCLRVLDDAGANYGVIPAGSGTLEEVLPDDGQGRLLG